MDTNKENFFRGMINKIRDILKNIPIIGNFIGVDDEKMLIEGVGEKDDLKEKAYSPKGIDGIKVTSLDPTYETFFNNYFSQYIEEDNKDNAEGFVSESKLTTREELSGMLDQIRDELTDDEKKEFDQLRELYGITGIETPVTMSNKLNSIVDKMYAVNDHRKIFELYDYMFRRGKEVQYKMLKFIMKSDQLDQLENKKLKEQLITNFAYVLGDDFFRALERNKERMGTPDDDKIIILSEMDTQVYRKEAIGMIEAYLKDKNRTE